MKLKFFLTFITRILKANPKVTLKIFLSLFLLSVTQACLIFFVKGFLDSFFIVDQNQVNINILQLLPVKITPIVYKFFPQVNFMVRRQLAIFFIPILIALAASARALILLTYSVSQSQFSALLTHQARTVIFTKIINQPFLDLAIVSPARWMSVVMNDVNFLQNKVTDFMTVFLRGFFVVASSFLALNFLQPATAYCLLVAGLFLVLLGARVGKKISSYSDFFQRQMAQISSHILNIRERFAFIKAQKGELFEAKKLNTLIDDYYSVMRRSIFISIRSAGSRKKSETT